MKMKRYFRVAVLGVSLVTAAAAQSRTPLNLQQMKNDIQIFEAILDQALDQLFANPFALTERAKGVYLSDYGTTFHVVVNIKTATMETPFGRIQRPEAADPKLREQKIQDLRQRMIQILASYGNAIGQLQDRDAVAVVAHVMDQNFNKKSQSKTIIIKALKKDLMATSARLISPEEFNKKVQIVEY